LPLSRPSGFVNSGRQGFSNQEGALRTDRRGMAIIGSYLPYRIGMLSA
jgi:hypothetical protein